MLTRTAAAGKRTSGCYRICTSRSRKRTSGCYRICTSMSRKRTSGCYRICTSMYRKRTSGCYRMSTDNVKQGCETQLDKLAISRWMLGYIRDQHYVRPFLFINVMDVLTEKKC